MLHLCLPSHEWPRPKRRGGSCAIACARLTIFTPPERLATLDSQSELDRKGFSDGCRANMLSTRPWNYPRRTWRCQILAQSGSTVAPVAERRFNFGRLWPMLGLLRPWSGQVQPQYLTDPTGPLRPTLGRLRHYLAQSRSILDEIFPPQMTHFGQNWPKLKRSSATGAILWKLLATSELAKFAGGNFRGAWRALLRQPWGCCSLCAIVGLLRVAGIRL